MATPGEDPAVTLTSADPQPPRGTVVRDDCGITWKRDYSEGYWLRVDRPDGDPESWAKIAGNYGPVVVLDPITAPVPDRKKERQ